MVIRIHGLVLALLIVACLAQNYRNYNDSTVNRFKRNLKSTNNKTDGKIAVTIWYEHIKDKDEHNNRNLLAIGSIKKMISECHPNAVFNEVDLSSYNNDLAESKEKAKKSNVKSLVLSDGPEVDKSFN